MADDISYKCILEFDDQSPSFTLGFQAGSIWEQMKRGEPFEDMFCGENLELIQRMPSRKPNGFEFVFTISEFGKGWYGLKAELI